MKKAYIAIILILVIKIALSFSAYHDDLKNHMDWGIRFWQYGASGFYTSNVWSFTWPNQPPGTIYIFALTRKIFESLFALFSFLHFSLKIFPGSLLLYLEQNLYPSVTKLPAILADFGIAFLIYKIIYHDLKMSRKKALIAAFMFILNPVVWYNSTIWGQYDSVINFFALLSFYLLNHKNLILAFLFFILSIYIKASLLIFLPVFLLISIKQKYKFKEYLSALLVSLFTVFILTIPFSQAEPLTWLTYIYTHRVFNEQLQLITANAFNLWNLIAGIDAKPQTLNFLGANYQYYGYILTLFFSIPIFKLLLKKNDAKSAIWSLAVISFLTFMFLTNMHERYLYPLFPYMTILAVVYSELLPIYILVSIISLINLYNFWWVPDISFLVNILSAGGRLATRFLSAVNLMLFTYFYLHFLKIIPKDNR